MSLFKSILEETNENTINEIEEKEVTIETEDNSGFDNNEVFGVDKIDPPETEGVAAAIQSADQFANASDGQDTDIDLSFKLAFPVDESGFEEDANLDAVEVESDTEVTVAPETVPAVNAEDDQFTFPGEEEQQIGSVEELPAEELANDSDMADAAIGETATGWADLF